MIKWTRRSLGDVADLCLGKMLDERKNRGEPHPYLANLNVRWGEFDLENLRQMRFEDHEKERYGLKCGDVVMCEGGEPGRCAIWKEDEPGMMFQKALHRIRPHPCLDSRFLFYSFLQSGRMGGFSTLFTGSTIKHLPLQNLAKVEVTFPELPVQKKIADMLSAYDSLLENNRQRMGLVEEAARLLYREWFVHLRFPGHERTKIKNGVPAGWKKQPLDALCVEGNGIQTGPFGSQLHQSDYTDEGVPVVMPQDLVEFRISTEHIARIPEDFANKLSRHRMQANDIVYGRRGDIGRRAFVTSRQAGWLCGTGSLRLRPDSEAINPRYLFDALGSPETAGTIANRAKGATMLNLNATVLKSVPVLCPPRELQDRYNETINPMTVLVEILAEQNQKLRDARDLLLPRLMSGEIAV